jgi:MFS family permease
MFTFGALIGVSWGPLGPLLNTVIQRKIPANIRGRVFSLEMTVWTAGPMMSMTLTGLAVDAWGVRWVYPCLAGAVMLAAILISTNKNILDLNGTSGSDPK